MTKFAILKIGSTQFKVSEGQELPVPKQKGEKGTALSLSEVLLVSDGAKISLGQPYLPKAKVTAQITDQVKGPKIRISTYKAKARFRKVKGFRSQLTKIKIDKISLV